MIHSLNFDEPVGRIRVSNLVLWKSMSTGSVTDAIRELHDKEGIGYKTPK